MPKGIPDKNYSDEFKQMVVETIQKEHLSSGEAARRFEVRSDTQKGLYLERRGRSSNGRGRPPKQLKPEVEEDLIAEVQRLRAENAYLKKLRALIQEE